MKKCYNYNCIAFGSMRVDNCLLERNIIKCDTHKEKPMVKDCTNCNFNPIECGDGNFILGKGIRDINKCWKLNKKEKPMNKIEELKQIVKDALSKIEEIKEQDETLLKKAFKEYYSSEAVGGYRISIRNYVNELENEINRLSR